MDVDVLIAGAGISGIGFACHLRAKHPQRSIAILEARDSIGGTWDLFRYPGIRSDSDLATFGYSFKPWTNRESIAGRDLILDYLHETVAEAGIEPLIRLGHTVESASWDSDEQRWTVTASHGGETVELTARWLVCGCGYFRYDRGHLPELPGVENFEGPVIHPQHWDESVDCKGKDVVIIGSGASAVTIAPALAADGARVTVLQRSPSYFVSMPSEDRLAALFRRVLGDKRGHALTRRKNIFLQRAFYRLSRARPELVKRAIRRAVARQLPEGYDVDIHFNPRYDPWDQRICLAPNGDFFAAIRRGGVTMETDTIAGFDGGGVLLASGKRLPADVVVSATGLELLPFGGLDLEVDGEPVVIPETNTYKGMMLAGVPNFAYGLGYINASWTLKVDLSAGHLCRLLSYLDERGIGAATPEAPPPSQEQRPLLDFTPGYVLRALHLFPLQGEEKPWILSMDYADDARELRHGPVADHMRLVPAAASAPAGSSSPG